MDVFNEIYQNNFWKSDESVSGYGSTMEQTETIRKKLPVLFKSLNIKSVLDIPCGDLNWFPMNDMPDDFYYMGADIVPELVGSARDKMRGRKPILVQFEVMDITKDKLPPVDLILVRDLLGHFSNADVRLALKNIKQSGAKYLLATTFPSHENVTDITTGQWRPINLASLFGLPDPIMMINENCEDGDGKFSDKSLGLWEL